MQPALVAGETTLPKGNAVTRGGTAKPGEFDLVMAMLGSALNTVPVETAQQQILLEDIFPGKAPGKNQLPGDLMLFCAVNSNNTVETMKPGLPAVSNASQVLPSNQPQGEVQARQLTEAMPASEPFMPNNGPRGDIPALSDKKAIVPNVAPLVEEYPKAESHDPAKKQLQVSEPVLAGPFRDVHRAGSPGQTSAAGGLHQQQIQQPVTPDSASKPQELEMVKDTMKDTSARQNHNGFSGGSSQAETAKPNMPQLNNLHPANTRAETTESNLPQLNNSHPANTQAASNVTVHVSSDLSRGVTLGGLNDRMVQEFKHVFINFRGEQQSRVHLKLEPEHLGTVTIKLFISRGDINAHFYTGNVYVKEALENSMQQLREMLGIQELKLNEALVFSGNGGRDWTGSNFEEHQDKRLNTGSHGNGAGGEAETERPEMAVRLAGSNRVNYLV